MSLINCAGETEYIFKKHRDGDDTQIEKHPIIR